MSSLVRVATLPLVCRRPRLKLLCSVLVAASFHAFFLRAAPCLCDRGAAEDRDEGGSTTIGRVSGAPGPAAERRLTSQPRPLVPRRRTVLSVPVGLRPGRPSRRLSRGGSRHGQPGAHPHLTAEKVAHRAQTLPAARTLPFRKTILRAQGYRQNPPGGRRRYRAIQNDFEARFTTATALIEEFFSAKRAGKLRQVLPTYTQTTCS